MNKMVEFDQWCLSQTGKAVNAAYEWLSIPQRTIEASLAVLSLVLDFFGNNIYGFTLAETVFLVGFSGFVMICLFMMPRQSFCVPTTFRPFMMSMYLTYDLCPRYGWHTLVGLGQNFCFMGLLYVLGVDQNGDRGRKRKLALDKLKEMFGADWKVEPMGRPV